MKKRSPAAPPPPPAAPFLPLHRLMGHPGVEPLRLGVAAGTLAHAYLFHGPAGVGKGSAAAGLAQLLFCRAPLAGPGAPRACTACPPCLRMAAGSHPDFQRLALLEGKTRISVDQVRELIQFLGLTALEEGSWKVAVVDDAALMNDAAANALLKTLEEPTPHTLLVLVTSRPGTLPATIRSRCRLVRFGPLEEGILARLVQELEPELPDSQCREAARLARGSVPRALECASGEYLQAREQLAAALDELSPRRLGSLCLLAEGWSKPAEFPRTVRLLEEWLRERIHASVKGAAGDPAAAGWRELAEWWSQLARRAFLFNLNRQLVLEALLIRILRLRAGGS